MTARRPSIEFIVATSGIALFIGVATSTAFAGCGGRAGSPDENASALDASVGDASSSSDPANGDRDAGPPSVYDGPSFGDLPDTRPPPFDAGPPPDAGAEPVIACDLDAAASGDADADATASPVCPLPSSVCLNLYWLLSYSGGACINGQCRYSRVLMNCTQDGLASQCIDGACQHVAFK
jgi:hypothetical protein